jgi:hypothetical protein
VGGSGFFDVSHLSGHGVVDHKYHPNNQSVAVTPATIGETVLSIRDLCLVTFLLLKKLPAYTLYVVIGV